MKIRLYGLVITLFCLSANSAIAGERESDAQVNMWQMDHVTFRYRGPGYSDKQKSVEHIGDILFTTSTTKHGLYLNCVGGKFRAGLVFAPQDMKNAFNRIEVKGVGVGGKLILTDKGRISIDMKLDDGSKIGLGRWVHNKKTNSAFSIGRKSSAKLYNAVVRKQKVTIFVARHKPIILDLPKPNKAFAEFGAGCGIGKLAKKE